MRLLLLTLLYSIAGLAAYAAGAPCSPTLIPMRPFPGQEIEAGGFVVRIVRLSSDDPYAVSGEGLAFVPFLGRSLPVQFEKAQFNPAGQLAQGVMVAEGDAAWPVYTDNMAVEDFLSRASDGEGLPVSLNRLSRFEKIEFQGYDFVVNRLKISPSGAVAEAAVWIHTPEDQYFPFIKHDLNVSAAGPDFCGLQFLFEINGGQVNDPQFPLVIKGHATDPSQASGIEFDCAGFKEFNLRCEYIFPPSQLYPVNPALDSVRATFEFTAPRWGEFIGFATIDSFYVNGVDDFIFSVSNVVVDYSATTNSDFISPNAINKLPLSMQTAYREVAWKGLYIRDLSVSLPEGMASSAGNRFSISIQHFFYARGDGITGDAVVSPYLRGGIEGWSLSLDEVRLRVIRNSPDEVSIKGFLGMPVLDRNSNYTAKFRFVQGPAPAPGRPRPKRMSAELALDLAGNYRVPMLNAATLTLYDGSKAEIRYTGGKFQPMADLSGKFTVSISNPNVSLPDLEFTNFKLNDTLIHNSGFSPSNLVKTGGLDKISFKSFSFGGINLLSPGWGSAENVVAATTNNTPASPGETADNTGAAGSQQSLSGMPLSIKDIKFGAADESDGKYYKLSFSIALNFASGANAFYTQGRFGILTTVDFPKLLTARPWDALTYKRTDVEAISVKAKLNKVAIEGAVRIIKNDYVYGDGFKGALTMKVDNFLEVRALAQFGSTTYGGSSKYRYFYVDALGTFQPGKPIEMTLGILSIYGFGGGLYYNMRRDEVMTQSQMVAAMTLGTQSVAAPTSNGPLPDAMQAPGYTLSPGIRLLPQNGTFGFKATLVSGLTSPSTLLLETTLGLEFEYSDFAFRRMYFRGDAYAGFQSVAERSKAAVKAYVDINFNFADLQKPIIHGTFGANIKYPIFPPYMITGGYTFNETALGRPYNFYFDKNDWYVLVGSPNNRFTVAFEPFGVRLASVGAYVMLGKTLSGQLPDIATVIPQLAGKVPSAGRGFSSLVGSGRGIALGMKLDVPRRSFTFLALEAYFEAYAGFDASLLDYSRNAPNYNYCGDNGNSFGLNYWYLQGQAYAYVGGGISIRVRLPFYSRTIRLADASAGVVLQAKTPNPTWLKGYIFGRYSVLSGLIRGSFNFEMEYGKNCNVRYRPPSPFENIDLFADFKPDGDSLEIFDDAVSTFNFPVGPLFDFEAEVDSIGTKKKFAFQLKIDECYYEEVKSKKRINAIKNWDGEKRVLSMAHDANLAPLTEYKAVIKVSWNDARSDDNYDDSGSQTKEITFTTRNRPTKIAPNMLAYHAPGLDQRFWYKNYVKPRMAFKTTGWSYLFYDTKEITISLPANPAFKTAMVADGWTYVNAQGQMENFRKNVPVEYQFRITNLRTKEITGRPLSSYPGRPYDQADIAYKGVADGFSHIYRIPYLKVETINDKYIEYPALNDLELTQGDVYKLEIIRSPVFKLNLPNTTVKVDRLQTALLSAQTTTSDMNAQLEQEARNQDANIGNLGTPSSSDTSYNVRYSNDRIATDNISAQGYGIDVLYTYHFGVSRYNSLKDKLASYRQEAVRWGALRDDWGHPDQALLKIKAGNGAPMPSKYFVMHTNPDKSEPIDKFDQIFLRSVFKDFEQSSNKYPYAAKLYSNTHVICSGCLPITWSYMQTTMPTLIYDLIENGFMAQVPRTIYNANGQPMDDTTSLAWAWRGSPRTGSTLLSREVWAEYARTVTRPYYDIKDWGILLHTNRNLPLVLTETEKTSGQLPTTYSTTATIPGIGTYGSTYATPWSNGGGGYTIGPSTVAMAVESNRERLLTAQNQVMSEQANQLWTWLLTPYDRKWSTYGGWYNDTFLLRQPTVLETNLIKYWATYGTNSGGIKPHQYLFSPYQSANYGFGNNSERYIDMGAGWMHDNYSTLSSLKFKFQFTMPSTLLDYFHSEPGSGIVIPYELSNYRMSQFGIGMW